MAKTTQRQRKTEGRVMHEFKHGELKRGRGGTVKSRKQAIAIALSEAGASNQQSNSQKRKAKRKITKKEARGDTNQQRHEGKSAIGARHNRTAKRATKVSHHAHTRKTRASTRKKVVRRSRAHSSR